jgi:hypothetical protein
MMTPQQIENHEYDHSVTSEHTVMHWILYALDAWESQDPEQHREDGAKPKDVWDFASGPDDDSIVFRDDSEARYQMKQLATERGALARRTDETGWHGDDVDWYYRLNDCGREALLDLGVPGYLPNRKDPEFDRQLPMEPSHRPGWWIETNSQSESDVDEGWQTDDNEWVESGYEDVYYFEKRDQMMCQERGYHKLGEELSEAFPEATFVLTSGPHRMHDLMYRIRDPFNKVVQIDVYSPMAMHRTADEVVTAFKQLVKDLHGALQQVEGDSDG